MNSAGKAPAAWKRWRAPTFPHYYYDERFSPTEVCKEQQGRKNSHNGVSAA